MKPKYWTITILAVAAICTSIFYYLRQPAAYSGPIVVPQVIKVQPQATTTSQTDTTASTSPTTSSPTTQAQGDTSGWKTYTDSQYGFSFYYPINWEVTGLGESGSPAHPEMMAYSAPTGGLADGLVRVGLYTNSNALFSEPNSFNNIKATSLNDWVNKMSKTPDGISSFKPVVVDNISGYETFSADAPEEVIYFEYNNQLFYVETEDYTYQQNVNVLNKIVSTFKFTN